MILSRHDHRKILNRFHVEQLLCDVCGKPIELGAEIRIKYPVEVEGRGMKYHPGRAYHASCFESLYIEC